MSEHFGYDKHDPVGQNHGNSRNGVRSTCPVTSTPRSSPDCAQAAASADRGGSDRAVTAARGLTSGEISAHFAEVYGASVSRSQSQAGRLLPALLRPQPGLPVAAATQAPDLRHETSVAGGGGCQARAPLVNRADRSLAASALPAAPGVAVCVETVYDALPRADPPSQRGESAH
jgi:hypothetical protein